MAKLRLLVSKTKSWHIKNVCLIANEEFVRADTNELVRKGQKIPYTRTMKTEADLHALNVKLKTVFWDDVELRIPRKVL